jgi:hypothetical protein
MPRPPVWSSTSPKPVIALISAAARMAPTTCAAQYAPVSAGVIPRLRNTPSVTGIDVATRDRAYGVRQGEQQEAESKAHANLANLAV